MTAQLHTPYWTKYQAVRDRIHAIGDQVDIAGNDLAAVARLLPSDSYPIADMEALVREIGELHEHAREVLESARAKHVNGIEADRNIDALIGTSH